MLDKLIKKIWNISSALQPQKVKLKTS
jgi:hypothetical protein